MTEIVKVERVSHHCWRISDFAGKHVQERPVLLQYVVDAMAGDDTACFVGAWSSIVGWGLSRRVRGHGEW